MQTFSEYLTDQYPQYNFLLSQFSEQLGEQPQWQHFTKTNLIKLRKGMQEKVCANSARTYIAVLTAIFGQVSDEGVLPCKDYKSVLNVRKEASTAVFLTEPELERLKKVQPRNDTERYVLFLFIIQAYTGCRVSDAMSIMPSNIQDNRLTYVSEKTKIEANVPVKPIVAEMIERLQTLKPVSNMTYSTTIKKLCLRAKITEEVKIFKGGKNISAPKWNFVSSHTARRSFATNLYLRGLDLYSISKFMGHSETAMTEGYICCGIRDINDNIKTFFE